MWYCTCVKIPPRVRVLCSRVKLGGEKRQRERKITHAVITPWVKKPLERKGAKAAVVLERTAAGCLQLPIDRHGASPPLLGAAGAGGQVGGPGACVGAVHQGEEAGAGSVLRFASKCGFACAVGIALAERGAGAVALPSRYGAVAAQCDVAC